MSSFTDELIVSPLPDGKHWVVRKAFRYYIGAEGSDEYVDVPAGFITDFASVPRFFWRIVPRWGKYGKAAVVHDYLYWLQGYTRKRSDEIFLEAMGVLEVKKSTAQNMYKAVRCFGGKSWKANMKMNATRKFVRLKDEFIKIRKVTVCTLLSAICLLSLAGCTQVIVFKGDLRDDLLPPMCEQRSVDNVIYVKVNTFCKDIVFGEIWYKNVFGIEKYKGTPQEIDGIAPWGWIRTTNGK